MNRLDQWFNYERRYHPIRFWFGFALPLYLFLLFVGLLGIVVAVKEGVLR